MATYVLIHGAGSDSSYWHKVGPQLQARGHDVVAVDLQCDDDSAGLAEYTGTVVELVERLEAYRRSLLGAVSAPGGPKPPPESGVTRRAGPP